MHTKQLSCDSCLVNLHGVLIYCVILEIGSEAKFEQMGASVIYYYNYCSNTNIDFKVGTTNFNRNCGCNKQSCEGSDLCLHDIHREGRAVAVMRVQ